MGFSCNVCSYPPKKVCIAEINHRYKFVLFVKKILLVQQYLYNSSVSSLANFLWGQDGGSSSERCSDWWVILLVEFQRSEKRWWIFAPDCFMSFYRDAFRMTRCLQIKMYLFSLHMLSFCHWCCFFVAPCAVLNVFMTDYFPGLFSTCRQWGKVIVSNITHFIRCDKQ